MSSLLESTETMQESYGFSPASLEWELLAQSEDGAAVLMQLPDDADVDAIAGRLEGLGYEARRRHRCVAGRPGPVPGIGTLTPELQYLALDADRNLVVASDTESYAEVAIETVTGERDGFDGLDEVVESVGEPLAAALYGGDLACTRSPWATPTRSTRTRPSELFAAAGEVNPLTGYAMARGRDGLVRVAMTSRRTTRRGPTPTPARGSPLGWRRARGATSRTGSGSAG